MADDNTAKEADDGRTWFVVPPGWTMIANATGPFAVPGASLPNYAFLLNLDHIPGGRPREIAQGHLLRRATDSEIAEIQFVLKKYSGESMVPLHYETEFVENGWRALPRRKWRYYVIQFGGSNKGVADLDRTLMLFHRSLQIGFTAFTPRLGIRSYVLNGGQLFNAVDALKRSRQPTRLLSGELALLSALYGRLLAAQPDVFPVEQSLLQLDHLRNLPHVSPLRFLGLFAILEGLLTHAPKPTDPYDSITRQVRTKLTLLAPRFARPLRYGEYFGAMGVDKVWPKLYAVRSAVAHGARVDFSGEWSALKDLETCIGFIAGTVRKVLRQALEEPALLRDLRSC